MTAILKKEMKLYFNAMTGYIFLFFIVLLTAIFFAFNNILGMNVSYGTVLSTMIVILLILAPVLTMRLFAEESRQKTDQLLFTSPLTTMQIVMGKFLAACAMLLVALLITGLFPLMVSPFGELPWAEIFTAHVGFFLLGCAFLSVGLFVSTLTENQIVAAVGTFASLFMMYLMDSIASGLPATRTASLVFAGLLVAALAFILWSSTRNLVIAGVGLGLGAVICVAAYFINPLWYDGLIVKVFQWLSTARRFNSFGRGVFSLTDMVYYLSFCAAFVYLTVNKLEKRRWS